MDAQKVDTFMMTNAKYFPADKVVYIKEKLSSMDDSKLALVSTISFKDPTVVLILSIFFGCLGVDRFMLGQVGLGLLKLFTAGGCGVWAIIDVGLSFQKRQKKLTSISS
jgi:hypothetical protein